MRLLVLSCGTLVLISLGAASRVAAQMPATPWPSNSGAQVRFKPSVRTVASTSAPASSAPGSAALLPPLASIGQGGAGQKGAAPKGAEPVDESSPTSPSDVTPEMLQRVPSPTGLSLADLEQRALTNNPSLGQAAARVEAARGNWVQVGLPPNPYVGYSGQQLGSRGQAEQDGVVFGQDIVRGHKLRLNRVVADREVARAEQELAAQEQRVLTDVRLAYYDVLIAQRRLDVNQELLNIGGLALNAAEALLRAKEVSRVDVLQAKLENEQAQILFQNARNRHMAAWRGLSAVVGEPQLPPQPLDGDLERMNAQYEWNATLHQLLGTSPEISTAVFTLERARAAVDRARAEATPNISIQAIVQRDAAVQSTNGAIQATMPVPIFNRNQGGIRQAESQVVAAERALQRVELDLQQRLAQVFERYANARHQVDKYRRDILPNAKESLDLTREGYRAGELGFLSLLTVQRTYFQTNLGYLESLRELWNAAMEIEGQLLRDSLQAGVEGE